MKSIVELSKMIESSKIDIDSVIIEALAKEIQIVCDNYNLQNEDEFHHQKIGAVITLDCRVKNVKLSASCVFDGCGFEIVDIIQLTII